MATFRPRYAKFQINHPHRIQERQRLIAAGKYP